MPARGETTEGEFKKRLKDLLKDGAEQISKLAEKIEEEPLQASKYIPIIQKKLKNYEKNLQMYYEGEIFSEKLVFTKSADGKPAYISKRTLDGTKEEQEEKEGTRKEERSEEVYT